MAKWKNEQECFETTLHDSFSKSVEFEKNQLISEIKEKLSAEELVYLYYLLDRAPVNAVKQNNVDIGVASCEPEYQHTTEAVRLICDLIITMCRDAAYKNAENNVRESKLMGLIEDRESDQP